MQKLNKKYSKTKISYRSAAFAAFPFRGWQQAVMTLP